jgi:hypothetical protein
MDTKFWGPGAWKLLHMASFQYTSSQKDNMKTFLYLLPFVLPCKFCRKSLTEYYVADPPVNVLSSESQLSRWLWRIHNNVNDKLRSQGQAQHPPNPPYKGVKDMYKEYLAQGCSETIFPGWEFLFSILDNHPFSKEGRSTKPFEYNESDIDFENDIEKNRFNLLTPEERITYIISFFKILPAILPYREWEETWNNVAGPVEEIGKGRRQALAWLWKIRSALEKEFELKNKDSFLGVCSTVAAHRSSCSKSARAKTCRKKRIR